jgi:hypothetical protein
VKQLALFWLLMLAAVHPAAAAGVVHIADGDCTALTSTLASAAHDSGIVTIALTNKSYGICPLSVPANTHVSIDGGGASIQVDQAAGQLMASTVHVNPTASLVLRNLNIVWSGRQPVWVTRQPCDGRTPLPCLVPPPPIISNEGDLVLDSISISGVAYLGEIVSNSGSLSLLNSTIVNNVNADHSGFMLSFNNSGNDGQHFFEIINSTIAENDEGNSAAYARIFDPSSGFKISNSLIAANTGPICNASFGQIISLGGNIFTDASCGVSSPHDRVVADAGLGAFDNHGGVVSSIALASNSPAIGNGLAANCEATDARGAARGQTHCDAGAYEFGGGLGQLGVSGTSGLYFNSGNNGHYVTVQRVFDDNALVIWNTFDQAGKPAWVYGVGSINGGHIHVDQVAENLGGVLHPGGGVSGVTPTFWGTFDVDFSGCDAATLSYNSALPKFGSGTVSLERLAFVTGLDCSP